MNVQNQNYGLNINLLLLVVFVALLTSGVVFYHASIIGNSIVNHISLSKKLVHTAAGFVLFLIGMIMPYHILNRRGIAFFGLLASIILLALTITPLGVSHFNAKRWLSLGYFEFQPSELVKFFYIVYFANFITRKKDEITSLKRGVLPHLILGGFMFLFLYWQPDFGAGMILFSMLIIFLFVGRAKLGHILAVVFGVMIIAVLVISASEVRKKRLFCALKIKKCSKDDVMQIESAESAYFSGGLTGKGLGNGDNSNQNYLIMAESDFIAAVIGEETGFLGVFLVIFLYIIYFLISLSISLRCPDEFGKYLAFGIGLLISIHAIIHFGVTMRILPTKGLVLPFISSGGTTMSVFSFATGVLMNIDIFNRKGEAV